MKRITLIEILCIFLFFGCGKKEKDTSVEKIKEVKPIVDTVEVIKEELPKKPISQIADTAIKIEKEVEKLPPIVDKKDSVIMLYMVRPNDWLIKIAMKEYNDKSMWREIYSWNKEIIGSNPNLIYPFEEYTLKKPPEKANPVEYEFYQYKVKYSETLWNIADKEYGNAYAWVVIYKDNRDKIRSDSFKIPAGTILNLRTKLF